VAEGSLPDPGKPDETALLERARRDPEAFGEFYERTHRIVLRFFLLRTACPTTAADLSAETFAAALRSIGRYDPALGAPRTWLLAIADNLHKQYLRREAVGHRTRQRLRVRYVVDDTLDTDRIDALVDFQPLLERIVDALDALPDGTRDAVILRVVDQLPYDRIADKLGCTVGAARVRVSRGLTRIVDQLEELP
jgi:RNA polymerase sigma-70 factor (ECF subfamily)